MTYLDNTISPNRVVFDGQSLNTVPGFPNNYPTQLMTGRGIPQTVAAISGMSWTVLSPSAAERCFKYAPKAERAILVMCGGTMDIGQEDDTGATVYAQMGVYANAARTAGFDKIIMLTITPSKTYITDLGSETDRTDCNTLIVADAADYFDAVVDVAADSRLSDYTNATYYEQTNQTHWTTAGAAVTAELVAPVLQSLLA